MKITSAASLLATLLVVSAQASSLRERESASSSSDEREECVSHVIGRRVIGLLIDGMPPIQMPPLVGEEVSQTSYLCDGRCDDADPPSNVIGSVSAAATVVPGGTTPQNPETAIRLGRGAYMISDDNILYGPGNIYFQGSVGNTKANGAFEVAITGGTGPYRCAEGFIQISKVENPDEKPLLKRNATITICGETC